MTEQNIEEAEEVIFGDSISTVTTTLYPHDGDEREVITRTAGQTPFVFLELVQNDGLIAAEITASWVNDYDELIELLEMFLDTISVAAEQQGTSEPDADA